MTSKSKDPMIESVIDLPGNGSKPPEVLLVSGGEDDKSQPYVSVEYIWRIVAGTAGSLVALGSAWWVLL